MAEFLTRRFGLDEPYSRAVGFLIVLVIVQVAPLEHDPDLVPVARTHARDMWRRGYFSHVSPDGEDPFDRMRQGGVRFRVAGENLALAGTTGLAHRGLMDSPTHRRNILHPAFSRIGIGVVHGAPYGKMHTQLFAD